MNAVFVGGSRSISRLNKKLTRILDKFADKGLTILVGDANGADKAVQGYLLYKRYKNVLVYCMGNNCRNNLGAWDTINVAADIKEKSYKYYFIKDLRMASDSQYGFMLWDSKSKGTLNNIINLLKGNKPTVVYFSSTREVQTLRNLDDLDHIFKKCDQQTINRVDSVLNTFETTHRNTFPPGVNETQGRFKI